MNNINGITVMPRDFCKKSFEIDGIVIVILGDGTVIDSKNPAEMYDLIALGGVDWRVLTLIDNKWHLASGWERTL